MAKTKIDWANYTINPVKGLCPMSCSYCYARRMYKRFKWDETIRFEEAELMKSLYKTKIGDKIFIGSTMELFGDWIEVNWAVRILDYVRMYPSRTFIFLTKQPQNLSKWSPFPDNCWIGVSITNAAQYREANNYLPAIKAKVKFVSFEPLLEMMPNEGLISHINWVIIGQQTPISIKTQPKLEWVKSIIDAADRLNIPLFLKNNLDNIVHRYNAGFLLNGLRQEFPIDK